MKPALRSYSEPSVVAGDAELRFAHLVGAEMELDFSAYVVGRSAVASGAVERFAAVLVLVRFLYT